MLGLIWYMVKTIVILCLLAAGFILCLQWLKQKAKAENQNQKG